jgi:hypothetical protein
VVRALNINKKVMGLNLGMIVGHISVSPGIEPGYIVFPSHKNNVQVLLGVLLPCEKEKKFLAVRRVSV